MVKMRSKWKGIFIHTILYKFANTKFKNFGPNWSNQKVNVRASTYIKKFISRSIMIHNGKSFINFKSYNQNYIDIKMGQFVFTRLPPKHSLINPERTALYYKMAEQKNKIKSKFKRSKYKNLKDVIK